MALALSSHVCRRTWGILVLVCGLFACACVRFADATADAKAYHWGHGDVSFVVSGESPSTGSSLEEGLVAALARLLQTGTAGSSADDFAAFNEIFRNAKIHLPDEKLVQRVVFNEFILDVSNLVCYNVHLDDMDVDSTVSAGAAILLTVNASVQVSMDCGMDYWYGFGSIQGSGSLVAKTSRNLFETVLRIYPGATNGTLLPSVATDACSARVDITDLEFHGGVVARVADLMQNMVASIVEKKVSDLVCDDLISGLGSDLLRDAMSSLNKRLDPFLNSHSPNPLQLERTAHFGSRIINMRTKTGFGNLLSRIIDQLDSFLTGRITDISGPNNGTELAVNILLRDRLLDESRALNVNISSIVNPMIFQSNDKVTESNLSISAIKVFGLDTLQEFSGIDIVGNYTLQTMLKWDFLKVKIDASLTMRASTQKEAIIEDPNTDSVTEHISVILGVKDLSAAVSLLVAIHEDRLADLQLGSLLFSDRLIPCLMSTLDALVVTGLRVTATDIQDPLIQGFVSPGFDHVISQLVKAALSVYKRTLLRAVPGAFQTLIRGAINKKFLPGILSSASCVSPTIVDEFIDLRDLFLNPTLAHAHGGSGMQPYGDVAHILYQALLGKFTAADADGLAVLNDAIIRPMTLSQSGSAGLFQHELELVSIEKKDMSMLAADRFELSLSDLRVQNLDTVETPLKLFQVSGYPYRSETFIQAGEISDERLVASIRLLIALYGDQSPLQMFNELEISASVDSFSLDAGVRTMLSSMPFQNFQLRYITDIYCWLSVFEASMSDEGASLEVMSLMATLSNFSVNASCISCTSAGTAVIPDLIGVFSNVGAYSILSKGVEAFVESYAGGPMRTKLLEMVAASYKLCPMSPDYDVAASRRDMNFPFPVFTAESLDVVLLVVGLATETALSIFMLSHYMSHQFSDPLAAEDAIEIPSSVKLLDWTDLGGSLQIGKLPDTIFAEIRGFLSRFDDSGHLLINDALDSSLLKTGVFAWASNFTIRKGDLSLKINGFEVSGLNTFTEFDVLRPISPLTFQNKIGLGSLGIKLDFEVLAANDLSQQVSVSFIATNVTLDLSVFAAFDLTKLALVTLESFFGVSSLLSCILSTAHSFDIPRFIVNVSSFSLPVIEGLEPFSASAMSSSVSAIADLFGLNMTAAIPVLFDTTVKGIITSMVKDLISKNTACSSQNAPSENTVSAMIDFRDLFLLPDQAKMLGGSGLAPYGSLFRKLFDLFKEKLLKIDENSGLSQINDIFVSKVTQMQSGKVGRIEFDTPFKQDTRVHIGGLDAKVKLGIYDAFVDHIDSIGAPLNLFAPMAYSASELSNTATIGVGPSLQAGARFVFGLQSGDADIFNDISLVFTLEDLSVIATTLLRVEDSTFRRFPIKDVLNHHCWLATMPAPSLDAHGVRLVNTEPSLSLEQLLISVVLLDLNLTCENCTSSGMLDLSELLSTKDAALSLTKSANKFFDYVASLLGGPYLQVALDRLLVESHRRCPHSHEFEGNTSETEYAPFTTQEQQDSFALFLTLALVVLTIIAIVWACVFVVRIIVRRRNLRWLRRQPTEVIRYVWHTQVEERRKEVCLNESTESLFRSQCIPCFVRLFIPVCIIGNIGLFLSGHLSLGATVTIVATIGEQSVTAAKFYEFSMAQSTIEIWKAGGKALAMFILIFSGIWPYTKQLVTLFLWFAPPCIVNVSKRGSIFLWLDVLAKWSFVDIMVLVVTMVGFRISVQSPDVKFLPKDFYSLDLLVIPLWGLYANMIAQIVSQISSHFIIHYHRRVIAAATARGEGRFLLKTSETGLTATEAETVSESDVKIRRVDTEEDERDKEALYQHAFSRPHRGDFDHLIIRRWTNPLLVMVAGAIVLFIVLGCALPVVSQDVLGIIGVMVESGQNFESATTYYSLFSIIKMLFEQAAFTGRMADYIGLGSLSVVLVLCVLIVPILQTSALVYQWMWSLNPRRRLRLSIAIECLDAWQYCDVFILAIVIASWQLGPVSQFMVGSSCDSLADTFAGLAYYGILKPEDAQCFRVDSVVASGSFLLVTAALLLTLLNVFVRMAGEQYLYDKSRVPYSFAGIDAGEAESYMDIIDRIDPVPVLFSDRFRWVLTRDDYREKELQADNIEGE